MTVSVRPAARLADRGGGSQWAVSVISKEYLLAR